MRATCWGAAGTLWLATAAMAADEPSSGADRVLRGFEACRRIAQPDARLDCFDKTAAALAQAVASKEVRIVDRADVRKARRSLFGFTLPNIDLFGGGRDKRDEDEFVEINSTVQSAREVANGRVEIRLADDSGAVWQTTDPMNFPPRPGAKIRIRKGALGNYFLNVGGASYRGMRVR